MLKKGRSSRFARSILIGVIGTVLSCGAPAPTNPPTANPPTISPPVTSAPSPAVRLLLLTEPSHGDDPRLIYDVASGGRWWAYRDAWNGPGPLHLAGADGSRQDFDLGPIDVFAPQAAAFSPAGTQLAVTDAAGALWMIDLTTLAAQRLAEVGPNGLVFGRSLRWQGPDRLYVQLAGSVEIPMPGMLGAFDIRDGSVTLLSQDTAAYGPRPLSDGGVAYVHLKGDGSYVVRRETAGVVIDVAEVGFIEGGLDIAADGAVAYADMTTVWLVTQPGGPAVELTAGSNPRFSPEGSVVVYLRGRGQSILVDRLGDVLVTVDSPYVYTTVEQAR